MFTGKWHIHRMGLVDFWYYENQEFKFDNGHLLLRGSNGSGKSVTMQSFIPLLLDGNKNSERLDAFGTRSRKIENYLIEEDSDRTDRIGYLWMEFKRENEEIYKTIGMGMRARINKKTDAWYFVIEDQRRINRDVQLLRNQLALTQLELKNLLGGGSVYTSRSEYMQRVNQSLFGFENQNVYGEMISLLVQLRSPKLSNSLKPTALSLLLQNSLQPLSDEELRPMSDAISSMEEQKAQLDHLLQAKKAADQVNSIYCRYNRSVLREKLRKFNTQQQAQEKLNQNLKENQKQNMQISQQREELIQQEQKKRQLQKILQEEKAAIRDSDILQLVEQQAQGRQRCEELTKKHQIKQEISEKKSSRFQDVRVQQLKYQQQKERLEINLNELTKDLDEVQEILQLEDHPWLKQQLTEQPWQPLNTAPLVQRMNQELIWIKEGLQLFAQRSQIQGLAEGEQDQLLRIQDQQKNLENEMRKAHKQYDEIIEEMKSRFYQWSSHNQLMILDDHTHRQIIGWLLEYEQERHYYKITQKVSQLHNEKWQEIHKQLQQVRNEQQTLLEQRQKLQEELTSWKLQDDPQPERDAATQRHRQVLLEQGAVFCPLYQKLEFSDTCSAAVRGRIEEILRRSGLLDCILIEQKTLDRSQKKAGSADQLLWTNKTLSAINSVIIDETLLTPAGRRQLEEALGICLGEFEIFEQGYRWGSYEGWISEEEECRYIGQKTRQQLRQREIDRCLKALEQIDMQLNALQQQLQHIEHMEMILNQEAAAMPQEDDLSYALQEITDREYRFSQLELMAAEHRNRIDKWKSQIKELEQQLQSVAVKMNVPCQERLFHQHLESIEVYKNLLKNAEITREKQIMTAEQLAGALQEKENLQQDLDELGAEISQLDSELSVRKRQLDQIERQLKDKNAEQLQKRLEYIEQQLRRLPDEITELHSEVGKRELLLNQLKDNAIKVQKEIEAQTSMTARYEQMVKSELAGGYRYPGIELNQTWSQILKQLETLDTGKHRLSDLQTELQAQFQSQRIVLQDYSPSYRSVLAEDELEDIPARLELKAHFLSKSNMFEELIDYINSGIQENQILFQEQERQLFEEIMINTINEQIRRHIKKSREWIERMNQQMSSMKTSSGLRLSLVWKGRKAESENELDSRELIALLEKDAQVLRAEDRSRLSSHFRTRLEIAKKETEKEDNQLTFHQIMRQVMDYRQWFEFTIYYQKGDERKKEMTNNAFYSFSGGEKAMAMYIPLFSATAAKYSMANPDAPMLIALDEAFAGVDEKNINAMFELIDAFGFDYIMNSQVLWGDYPSVRNLHIAELHRPDNAHYVSVVDYIWNGSVRKAVVDL